MRKLAASTIGIGTFLCLGLALLSTCAPPPPRNWSGMISSTVVIAAPPEKVFTYVSDWNNQLQWDPGLKGISEIEGSGIGLTSRWKYAFGASVCEGKTVIVDYVPNQRIIEKSYCDFGFETVTWLFMPQPPGTKLIRVYEGHFPTLPSDLQKMSNAAIQAAVQEADDANVKRIKDAVEKNKTASGGCTD